MASLEDLPNELFLEIFSYLSPADTFHSFVHLNGRFDSILCDTSVRLGIRVTNHNNTSQALYDFLDYFTHVQICCDEIDIQQFHYVRSLTLGPYPRPSDELLNQLIDQPQRCFPFLRQLTVYQPMATWYSAPAVRLWKQLFTNQLSPQLKRCSLPDRIFAIPTTCFYCRSLVSLSIGGCSLRDLPALLGALPNLHFLSTDLWGTVDTTSSSFYHHPNLSHLRIQFSQQTIDLDEIRCLLIFVPFLSIFTIEGTRKHDSFHVQEWYDVLSEQLECLIQFSCTIRLADTLTNETMDVKAIQEYHPLFSRMKLYRQNDCLFISNQ